MNEDLIFSVIINIILITISMTWINYDFLKRSKEFWESIKGADRVLQVTEMCIYIWIRMFPLIVLCDLFADKTISSQAWYSLDAVFFILIVGNLGDKFIQNMPKK